MTHEILTLTDADTGSTARILPAVGFNCFEFVVRGPAGPIPVIWAEEGFAVGDRRATGSGIPLLFPFPGRIQGTSLTWAGHQYELEPGDGLGNAIHGFVHERPWRVIEGGPARAVGQFQASVDDPQLLDRWPADFRITATYEISGRTLSAVFRMENPDARPLPCGFGTHPYFSLPLGGDSADSCRVFLPVGSSWELVDMNATGKKSPLENAQAFQQGQAFSDITLDNVFSDLIFNAGLCRAAIEDPASGQRMTLSFDHAFRECVVYTPPHRESICIEPYTCVPDPIRLDKVGIDAGLTVLPPGESLQARVDIALE